MLNATVVSRPGVASCPYCRAVIDDRPWSCPRCATPHHSDCVRENGGCTTFGCGVTLSSVVDALPRSPEPARAVAPARHERARLDLRRLLLAAAAGFVVFLPLLLAALAPRTMATLLESSPGGAHVSRSDVFPLVAGCYVVTVAVGVGMAIFDWLGRLIGR